jgi:hypothetical protein
MDNKPCDKPTDPAVLAQLKDLSERAQAGDTAALRRLRQILDAHPEVWKYVGDLSALVERAWASALSGNNPLGVESMLRTAAERKKDLAGEHASALEVLHAEQVVSCWMETRYAEVALADQEKRSLKQAGYRLKRLESAQKRYLEALKELVTVRGLLPDGQVPAPALRLHEPNRQRARA